MTVIAAFNYKNRYPKIPEDERKILDVPLLIGDISISNDNIRSKKQYNRKIYRITNNFAVGVAGTVDIIKDFLGEIYKKIKDDIVTAREVYHFLKSYSANKQGRLSVVGWIVLKNQKISFKISFEFIKKTECCCFSTRNNQKHLFKFERKTEYCCFSTRNNQKFSFEILFKSRKKPECSSNKDFFDGSGEKCLNYICDKNYIKHENSSKNSSENRGNNIMVPVTFAILHTSLALFLESYQLVEKWNETFGLAYEVLFYYDGLFRYLDEIGPIIYTLYECNVIKKTISKKNVFYKYWAFEKSAAIQKVTYSNQDKTSYENDRIRIQSFYNYDIELPKIPNPLNCGNCFVDYIIYRNNSSSICHSALITTDPDEADIINLTVDRAIEYYENIAKKNNIFTPELEEACSRVAG